MVRMMNPDWKKRCAVAAILLFISITAVTSLSGVIAQGEPVIKILDAATGSNSITLGSSADPFPEGGYNFTVEVTLQGSVTNLVAYQVAMKYNKTLLRCTGASVDDKDPRFIFYDYAQAYLVSMPTPLIVTSPQGYVFLGASIVTGSGADFSGGLLAKINFTAIKTDTSLLEIIPTYTGVGLPPAEYQDDSKLIDGLLHNLPFLYENCPVAAIGSQSPPTATFTFTPSNPSPGQSVAFDASESFTPVGDIASYMWDFGDNSTFETTENRTAHTFFLSGLYSVNLTVTDSNGLTGSAAQDVLVGAVPYVNFTFTPLEPLFTDQVTFNASESFDRDGNITSYVWDFGDGSNETITNVDGNVTAENATAAHYFLHRGVFFVNLTVFDNNGLFNTTVVEVLVGRRPSADFLTLPDVIEYPLDYNITFDASPSRIDSSAKFMVVYVWDFGDSAWPIVYHVINATDPASSPTPWGEGPSGTQPFYIHYGYTNATLQGGGVINVNLTVVDNDGLYNSVVKPVNITETPLTINTQDNTLYYAVAGAVFAVIVVGAVIVKKRQEPETARKERYRVI